MKKVLLTIIALSFASSMAMATACPHSTAKLLDNSSVSYNKSTPTNNGHTSEKVAAKQ